ncbi:MAG: HAD-IA family hydrolase [Woeseiaceae bacterium]|nr:HAD-IA family hydrolase [Woeseiaceae bacterium]
MSKRSSDTFDAILFDLDGTLIDTAPDMVAVLADMQTDYGRDRLAYDFARAHVSKGARRLVQLAFPDADDARTGELHQEYLDRYEKAVCIESRLFPGLGELLDDLDANRLPWGIVTNKPQRMTDLLLKSLDLHERSACTVSGDSLPQRKPDPAPLLHAAEQMGIRAENAVYVGDAAGDIQAGKAAKMFTVAASYGYITADDDPGRWNADLIAASTAELTQFLRKRVNLHA